MAIEDRRETQNEASDILHRVHRAMNADSEYCSKAESILAQCVPFNPSNQDSRHEYEEFLSSLFSPHRSIQKHTEGFSERRFPDDVEQVIQGIKSVLERRGTVSRIHERFTPGNSPDDDTWTVVWNAEDGDSGQKYFIKLSYPSTAVHEVTLAALARARGILTPESQVQTVSVNNMTYEVLVSEAVPQEAHQLTELAGSTLPLPTILMITDAISKNMATMRQYRITYPDWNLKNIFGSMSADEHEDEVVEIYMIDFGSASSDKRIPPTSFTRTFTHPEHWFYTTELTAADDAYSLLMIMYALVFGEYPLSDTEIAMLLSGVNDVDEVFGSLIFPKLQRLAARLALDPEMTGETNRFDRYEQLMEVFMKVTRRQASSGPDVVSQIIHITRGYEVQSSKKGGFWGRLRGH